MAKPLGPKSALIREAISKNPELGNTELAELVNGTDEARKGKFSVKPADIAAQKQAMKKVGATPATPAVGEPFAEKAAANGRKKGGRKRKAIPRPAAQAATGNALEAARQVKELVDKFGAETVKGFADLFAGGR